MINLNKIIEKMSCLFLFMFGQTGSYRIDVLIDQAPIHLSLEEVAIRAGHKVLMDVDEFGAQITVDPQGIIGKQLSLHTIHLLDIILSIKLLITKFYYLADNHPN
jgi:hypothetical protein